MPSRRELIRRVILGTAVTTAMLAVFVAWQGTLLGEYSVMEMGGSAQTHEGHEGHAGHAAPAGLPDAGAASVSVSTLTADPDRPADVRVELVARQERIDVPGGRPVDGYTVNTSDGSSRMNSMAWLVPGWTVAHSIDCIAHGPETVSTSW